MSSSSDSPTLNDHCEQCHSSYTLLKKRKICAVCRGNYCSSCAQSQRYQDQSYRICLICQLISNNSTTNDQLIELKVKQLKSYLEAKDISHNTCTEKQELVDLIAQNRNKPFSRLLNQQTQTSPLVNNSNQEQSDSASNMRSSHSRPFSNLHHVVSSFTNQMNNIASNLTDAFTNTLSDVVNQSIGEQPQGYPPTPTINNAPRAAPPNFGHANNPHGSSNRPSPSNARHRSQPPRGHPSPSASHTSARTFGSTATADQRVRRKSLSEIHSEDNIEDLNIRELKEILAANFVDFKGCVERNELIEKVRRLYRDRQNEKLKAKDLDDLTPGDTELCKICMDGIVDCVFLDCGHMVTCVKCGKLIAECPICRSNIVRVVRVFKS